LIFLALNGTGFIFNESTLELNGVSKDINNLRVNRMIFQREKISRLRLIRTNEMD